MITMMTNEVFVIERTIKYDHGTGQTLVSCWYEKENAELEVSILRKRESNSSFEIIRLTR